MNEIFDKEKETHEVWYKFYNHMKKWYYKEYYAWETSDDGEISQGKKLCKEFDSSKMNGYKCIRRCEKYAKKNKEIKIITVDDSVHAGSIIVLIPHPSMGITVILVPQCTNIGNQFFLYPHHAHNIVSEIRKMNYEVDEKW